MITEGFDLTRCLALMATDDPRAADEIDRLADQLRALAATLRATAPTSPSDPFIETGGMADRVRVQVVRPDGTVRHETDTNPRGS